MKVLLAFLIIIMIGSQSLQSQDLKELGIGPSLLYKAGVSVVNTPKGRKNGVAFNKIPDFGMSFYLPLSETSELGIATEVGYSTYSYKLKSAHNTTEYEFNHSYITFNPNFYFNGFLLGASFGVPMNSKFGDGIEVNTKTQNIVAEVKIGGMFPIFQDESGELNIVILGGYFFSGVYDDFVKNDPLSMKSLLPTDEPLTKIFNPRLASLGIGFNFHFNLVKRERAVDLEWQ